MTHKSDDFKLEALHPDHLEDLRRSGLTDETIAKAGIRSVPPRDISRILKWSPPHLVSAYEIPYMGTDFTRLRCFYDEKGKDGHKYLQPKGIQPRVFITEGINGALSDPSVPLYITEGEKKALKGVQEGLCCIGLGGLWGWKSGGKVLPDFDQIDLKDRDVGIIPDNDWQKQGRHGYRKNLVSAVEGLFRALTARGARVRVVILPESHEKIGLDDFLMQSPVESLEQLESLDASQLLQDETEKKKGPSQAKILVELASSAKLFHTVDGDCYATVQKDGHLENWQIRSRPFECWLSQQFYASRKTPPGSQALRDALNTIEGHAQFEGPVGQTFVRLASNGDCIYLDLADDSRRCVEITKIGWSVISNPPVKFLRPRGLLSIPVPEKGGSLNDLKPFLNVGSQEAFRLSVGVLVQFLNPKGPYPILILEGEQGSAKSTTSRALRSIVDPNVAPIRSMPKEERDLSIAAQNALVVAYDNLSGLPNWLSDAMCRLATGGGIGTRKLYTNGEEYIFEATRPMILNGIDQIATRHDLADRSIVITLPSIPDSKRQQERTFWAAFDGARPRILGALLDAVSMALRNIDSVTFDRLPRMADFALWVTAAEPALPWEVGGFMAAYEGNRAAAVEECLEADLVACAVQQLMAPIQEWNGTATSLLAALKTHVPEETVKTKNWPKDAARLSRRLRRNATYLRQVGIHVELSKSGERNISMSKGRENTVHTVRTVQNLTEEQFGGGQHPDGKGDLDGNAAVTDGSTLLLSNRKSLPQNNPDGVDGMDGKIHTHNETSEDLRI